MKVLRYILMLLPVPFLFHFYEYNQHLAKKEPVLLFPFFLFLIMIVGYQLRKVRFTLFIVINLTVTIFSLVLGFILLKDDGTWFKPFGRDIAIVFTSLIYMIGLLFVRWMSKASSSKKRAGDIST